MDLAAYVGRCPLFFCLAAALDVVGLIIFFIGIGAPLSYWDFLVFSGPLLMFASLLLWVFWYVGNLEVSMEEPFPV